MTESEMEKRFRDLQGAINEHVLIATKANQLMSDSVKKLKDYELQINSLKMELKKYEPNKSYLWCPNCEARATATFEETCSDCGGELK